LRRPGDPPGEDDGQVAQIAAAVQRPEDLPGLPAGQVVGGGQ